MGDWIDAYFAFFRQNGYATYYFIYACIGVAFVMVRIGELILDVAKLKRGFYDGQN